MTQKASRGARSARQPQASLGGGAPARERELRAQGRATMRKLLEAGRDAFDQRGFHAVRVDDVVKAARTSHGTFYLYFANKEDLFKALARDALHDMEVIAAEFPRVTPDDAGRAALGHWVQRFCDAYATHATVIRILSQADVIGKDFFTSGLQLLFRLSEAITQGMTDVKEQPARPQRPLLPERGGQPGHLREVPPPAHSELTALACLMMLERVNYLLSVGVKMPRAEMAERITSIIFAAFHAAP
ncbi:MAG TPA: helix-turn-helix domain-containing protein [Streptosporangiaceae bacterium]|nr:helix-turn-helix domain-containing protein [Streptosporangiaceae bacterium]